MIDEYAKKLINVGELKITSGVLEMFGRRGILLPITSYQYLFEILFKIFGEKIFDILYECGFKHGKTSVTESREKFKITRREYLNNIIRAGNLMGLGEAKIISISDKKIIIRLTNSPLVEIFKKMGIKTKRPVDSFEEGIFSGIFSEIYRTKMSSKETKCVFLNDPYCEFIIERQK